MSLVVQQSVTSTGLPSLVSRDTEAGRNEISCVRSLSGKEQSRAQPRGALLTPAPGPVTSCHLRVQSHVHVTCWGWSTCQALSGASGNFPDPSLRSESSLQHHRQLQERFPLFNPKYLPLSTCHRTLVGKHASSEPSRCCDLDCDQRRMMETK